jgi:DNA-binding NarL/FixJ family response regulator
MRILLVDDHLVVRAGLRSLLEYIKGVEVVAEAADAIAALELARVLRPDVVIMDIAMPGMNGLEATDLLKHEMPEIRVIILSMHHTKEYVLQALKVGASAYLLKDSAAVELGLAIEAVRRGDTYLSPAVSKQLIEHSLQQDSRKLEPVLTPRQSEVLLLVANGHSTKEIAHLLKVNVKTVETHRTQLMERLAINDIAGLVRYAIRIGLIEVGV